MVTGMGAADPSLEGEVPWSALGAKIRAHRATDKCLDPPRLAHMDRVQANLRDHASQYGVDLTAPLVVYTALILLEYMEQAALFDHTRGAFTTEEAVAVISTTSLISTAFTRWVPEGAQL